MKQPIILLDGKLLQASQKQLDQLAPWRLSGRGVFETMRVENNNILFLPEHCARLLKSLKILRIKSPVSRRIFICQMQLLIRLNPYPRARLRLAVWRTNHRTHFYILVMPLEKRKKVFQITISSSVMKSIIPVGQRVKSIDYQFFVDAYAAGRRRGYDEAIVFNKRNEMVEASRSNIFIVKSNCLFTPALSCGGLKGITRQIILNLARQQRIEVKEMHLNRDDLEKAAEVFLTNSVNGICPVVTIDHQKVGRGRPGPITKRLQSAYQHFAHQSS